MISMRRKVLLDLIELCCIFCVCVLSVFCCLFTMCGSRGDTPPPNPLKNHKAKGYYSNTGPNPLKNKATKLAFNVGPSSVRRRNIIKMAFRWRVDDDPLLVVLGSFLPSSTKRKKKVVRVGPLLTEISGSAHVYRGCSTKCH